MGSGCELFIDRRWFEVLHATYGFEFCATAIVEDDEITAALPFVVIDDIRGERLVSLPFCDFVDAPADDTTWPQLSAPIFDYGLPLRLETPSNHPAADDDRLITETDGLQLCIELDRPADELMAGYATLTRRQIRRAARDGITFTASTDRADLEAFHRLHVDVRKTRHELLAQPYALFENIADTFFGDDKSCLIVGKRDDEVVGGCLMLATPGALHYKFSASHPDARDAGVSHGAVHAAVQHGLDVGLPSLDLGRSDLAHGGLVEFKRRFRPSERTLDVHRRGQLTAPDVDRMLGGLTKLLVDPSVPDHITAAGGDQLYRFFA